MDSLWEEQSLTGARAGAGVHQLPESPRRPMEFLSRSWSPSALRLSKTLAPPLVEPSKPPVAAAPANLARNSRSKDIIAGGETEETALLSGNTFSFASSATSQLVLERIMSQSVSPSSNFQQLK